MSFAPSVAMLLAMPVPRQEVNIGSVKPASRTILQTCKRPKIIVGSGLPSDTLAHYTSADDSFDLVNAFSAVVVFQ